MNGHRRLHVGTMPFCNKCGSSIDAGVRFCNRCGTQLVSVPPQATVPINDASYQSSQGHGSVERSIPDPASPHPQATEKVLGAVPLKQSRSLGRFDNFAAVITDQRLIMAQVTKQVMNQAVTDARNEAKSQGKGYWGQISGQMAAWSSGYADRFLTMAPSIIISETSGNFAVSNNDLMEVIVRYFVGGEDVPSEYQVEFVTVRGRYKYKMEDRPQYVGILSKAFASKFKAPNGLPRGVTVTI